MRPRQTIEAEADDIIGFSHSSNKLILEVLLDIRDLLQSIRKDLNTNK